MCQAGMLFILLHLCVGDSWGQVLDILQKGAVFQWLRWWLGRIGQGSELAVEEAEGRDGAVDAPKEAGRGSVLPKE